MGEKGTFVVTAKPVIIDFTKQGPIKVFPNTVHRLTNASLLATSYKNATKPIVFTIMGPEDAKGMIL